MVLTAIKMLFVHSEITKIGRFGRSVGSVGSIGRKILLGVVSKGVRFGENFETATKKCLLYYCSFTAVFRSQMDPKRTRSKSIDGRGTGVTRDILSAYSSIDSVRAQCITRPISFCFETNAIEPILYQLLVLYRWRI